MELDFASSLSLSLSFNNVWFALLFKYTTPHNLLISLSMGKLRVQTWMKRKILNFVHKRYDSNNKPDIFQNIYKSWTEKNQTFQHFFCVKVVSQADKSFSKENQLNEVLCRI